MSETATQLAEVNHDDAADAAALQKTFAQSLGDEFRAAAAGQPTTDPTAMANALGRSYNETADETEADVALKNALGRLDRDFVEELFGPQRGNDDAAATSSEPSFELNDEMMVQLAALRGQLESGELKPEDLTEDMLDGIPLDMLAECLGDIDFSQFWLLDFPDNVLMRAKLDKELDKKESNQSRAQLMMLLFVVRKQMLVITQSQTTNKDAQMKMLARFKVLAQQLKAVVGERDAAKFKASLKTMLGNAGRVGELKNLVTGMVRGRSGLAMANTGTLARAMTQAALRGALVDGHAAARDMRALGKGTMLTADAARNNQQSQRMMQGRQNYLMQLAAVMAAAKSAAQLAGVLQVLNQQRRDAAEFAARLRAAQAKNPNAVHGRTLGALNRAARVPASTALAAAPQFRPGNVVNFTGKAAMRATQEVRLVKLDSSANSFRRMRGMRRRGQMVNMVGNTAEKNAAKEMAAKEMAARASAAKEQREELPTRVALPGVSRPVLGNDRPTGAVILAAPVKMGQVTKTTTQEFNQSRSAETAKKLDTKTAPTKDAQKKDINAKDKQKTDKEQIVEKLRTRRPRPAPPVRTMRTEKPKVDEEYKKQKTEQEIGVGPCIRCKGDKLCSECGALANFQELMKQQKDNQSADYEAVETNEAVETGSFHPPGYKPTESQGSAETSVGGNSQTPENTGRRVRRDRSAER